MHPVPLLSTVLQVSCGTAHTICMSTRGVFSWGCNDGGRLGTGDTKNRLLPVEIDAFKQSIVVEVWMCVWMCVAIVDVDVRAPASFYSPCTELSARCSRQVSAGAWHTAAIVQVPPIVKGGWVSLLRVPHTVRSADASTSACVALVLLRCRCTRGALACTVSSVKDTRTGAVPAVPCRRRHRACCSLTALGIATSPAVLRCVLLQSCAGAATGGGACRPGSRAHEDQLRHVPHGRAVR